MRSATLPTPGGGRRPGAPDGLLARAVRRIARGSARRPKTMIALWMLLVVVTSTGTVTDWVPLFALVILLGLSMDSTILGLERIRGARREGHSAREAAALGVGATWAR